MELTYTEKVYLYYLALEEIRKEREMLEWAFKHKERFLIRFNFKELTKIKRIARKINKEIS